MKFRCERDTLAEGVATAQRAVASRTGAMPVLSGLRVSVGAGSLELVGTDLELTIRVRVPAESDSEGSAVVPARLFSEIVRQLEGGTVTVELSDDDAHIEAGRFATTLRTLSTAEFPRLPETTETGVRVAAGAFAEALRQVVSAASRDDARPILTGVLLTASAGGLRLVATDSYRLALRDLEGVSMLAEGQKVLVAAKGLVEVQRLLASADGEIDVVLGEREVVFRVGSTEVTTRLIEGEFPNYQQLIPSGYPNRLTVAREALQAAVNRVRLVGQSRDTAPIRIGMTVGRPRALRDRAGRRRSARVGRGEVRRQRPHRGVQLAVPARRPRRRRVRRGGARVDRPVEARGAEDPGQSRLPLPVDARSHLLRRRPCTSPVSG